ncbi:MAG: hypothetical protein JO316_17400 [Abitibacteriaceae bacterium]|nr:hypothetical protein [Abditibacteriaceae bacterium]
MQHGSKTAFALLCLLGIIAITTGACLELVRKRRGESVISANQLRLRMMSAVIWLIILGSLCYAVLFLWPEAGNMQQARQFLSVVSGSFLLFGIALLLLLYDVWQVNRARRQHEVRFNQQLAAMARMEVEQMQKTRSSLSTAQLGTEGEPNPPSPFPKQEGGV